MVIVVVVVIKSDFTHDMTDNLITVILVPFYKQPGVRSSAQPAEPDSGQFISMQK